MDITEEQKELARRILSQNPFVNLLGIKLIDLWHGEAVCGLTVEAKHHRAGGFLHGGVTASLIDTVTAFAVATYAEQGENFVTVDLTIHYLRPVYNGEIKSRARVVRAGKRIFTVAADVFNQTDEIAATALTTYSKIVPKN
jgi:uncharacterized protein (TIGR00369 family)